MLFDICLVLVIVAGGAKVVCVSNAHDKAVDNSYSRDNTEELLLLHTPASYRTIAKNIVHPLKWSYRSMFGDL